MDAQNEKINDLFQDFDAVTIPSAAFITFQDSQGAALALKCKGERKMFGQPFKFKQASEPTDIIWENRHFTKYQTWMREIFGYGLVFVMLIASFYFIYWLASY